MHLPGTVRVARWNLLFCPELTLSPDKSQASQHRGHQGQPPWTLRAIYVSSITAPGCPPRNERSGPRLKFVWACTRTQASRLFNFVCSSLQASWRLQALLSQPSGQLLCGEGGGAASESSPCVLTNTCSQKATNRVLGIPVDFNYSLGAHSC